MGARDPLGRLTVARRFAAVVGLVLASLAPGAASVPAAHAAEPAADAAATLRGIATCLNSNRRLLLTVVIDESGSLRTTDPTNDRVAAAKLAMSTFASLATTRAGGTAPPVIDVSVFGFASDLTPALDWTRLDNRSLARIDAAIDGFATRNRGIDTDFPTAIARVQGNIATQSAAVSTTGGRTPCKVLLLFTDGRYDIEFGDSPARRAAGTAKEYAPGLSLLDPANKAAVERAGRDALCRTDGQGLADRLRGDGVTLVTIALAAQISPTEQQFLRALSSGDGGGGVVCGRRRGASSGTYVAADSLPELVPAFNQVATAIGGGVAAPRETVIERCGGRECVRATRRFGVDAGVGRFSVLADADTSGLRVLVVNPRGQVVSVEPGRDGQTLLEGVDVRWNWVSETAVSIDAKVGDKPAGWTGDWRVRFVDVAGTRAQARPRADVALYGDWSPRLVSEPRVLLGEAAAIALEVVDGTGKPVNPARFGAQARFSATVTDPQSRRSTTLRFEPLGEGRARSRFVTASSTTSSTLDLSVRLDVRTASGLQLAPRDLTVPMAVAAPQLYPQLVDAELQLSSVRGTGTARGVLRIAGGRDRAGCVWFGGARYGTFPSEAKGFVLEVPASSRDDCLPLAPGESRQLRVAIRPQASASGTVRGTLELLRVATGEERVLRASVPFAFDLAPPINQTERAGLFLAIFLPGVLLPILGLALANRAIARFEPPRGLVVARTPIAVERTLARVMRVHVGGDDRGMSVRRRLADGTEGPLEFTHDDFARLAEDGRRSATLSFGELEFRAHAPRNPFAAPYGTVRAPSPCRSGGVGLEPHSARLPLSLAGTWVFILRDDAPEGARPDAGGEWVHGDLVVLLADGPFDAELAPVLTSLAAELQSAANDADEEARASGKRASARVPAFATSDRSRADA
jgi:hypothetical protein